MLWIGLCKLQLESTLLEPIGPGLASSTWASAPPSIRWPMWPDEPLQAYGFLAVRFWGSRWSCAVIEEFFLRGFVMRFVVDADWWQGALRHADSGGRSPPARWCRC